VTSLRTCDVSTAERERLTRGTLADELQRDLQLDRVGGGRLLTLLHACTKWLHALPARAQHTSLLSEHSAYLANYSNKSATIYVPLEAQTPRVRHNKSVGYYGICVQSGHYCPEILRFAPYVHTIVHNDRVCRRFTVLAHNGKVCVRAHASTRSV
jgi:hypothetical protein